MPNCASQCILCDLPIRFDTYEGCSHLCKYCFAQRKLDISKIKSGESAKALMAFVGGARTKETNWADWNIPLHWGGLSDPFQPIERERKVSLEALKVFAETGYPVVISTKGHLCAEEPYISLIEKSNCVMQISLVCSEYDELEPGAPPFEERLKIVKTLAKRVKRVNIRVQPYVHEVFDSVFKNIQRFAEAGVYGVIFEGMKFVKKKPGLVKVGADWVQSKELLRRDFAKLKAECHRCGVKFYSGENRLRNIGDSLTCCGVDGLDDFIPNRYNINHIVFGDCAEPTQAQKTVGTARCFTGLAQTTAFNRFANEMSFCQMTDWMIKNKTQYVKDVFGQK